MSRVFLSWLCLGLWPALCQPPLSLAAPQVNVAPDQLPLEWRDEHGALTRFSQWHGKTLLMTMAYSSCRLVCSYALHRLEELQQSADRAGMPIEIIVVSYDPSIDTAGSWSIYRHHHHLNRANWHFLTGSQAATEQLVHSLQFPYWRYDDHLVHDFRILLIGPDGQIARTLGWANRDENLFTKTAAGCPNSDERDCKL